MYFSPDYCIFKQLWEILFAIFPVMLNKGVAVMLAGKYFIKISNLPHCMGVVLAGILQLTLPWIQLQRLFGWKWRFTCRVQMNSRS